MKELLQKLGGAIGYALLAIVIVLGAYNSIETHTIVVQHTQENKDLSAGINSVDNFAGILGYNITLICNYDHLTCKTLP